MTSIVTTASRDLYQPIPAYRLPSLTDVIMKYDDIYAHIGQMGLLQKIVCAEIFFFSLFGLDAVQMIFIGGDMDHWCVTPELTRLSDDMQRNIASPTAAVGYNSIYIVFNRLTLNLCLNLTS